MLTCHSSGGVDATQLHYSSNDEGDGDMIDDEAEPLPHFNDDVPLMADDCTASFRDDLVMPRPDRWAIISDEKNSVKK